MSVALFAGVYVGAFTRALPWYVRLLGEPTFYASETEAVWELAPDRWVYVQEHVGHAGHSVVTIFPEDLDASVAAIAGRGLEPARHEDYPGGVRKVVFADPDGNEVGLAGTPSEHRAP